MLTVLEAVVESLKKATTDTELTVDAITKQLSQDSFSSTPFRVLRKSVISALRQAEHEGHGKYIRGTGAFPSRFLVQPNMFVQRFSSIKISFSIDGHVLGSLEFNSNLLPHEKKYLSKQLKHLAESL